MDKVLAGEPFAGAAVGRVEDLGPLILDQITAWLQHANVIRETGDRPGRHPTRRPLRDPDPRSPKPSG